MPAVAGDAVRGDPRNYGKREGSPGSLAEANKKPFEEVWGMGVAGVWGTARVFKHEDSRRVCELKQIGRKSFFRKWHASVVAKKMHDLMIARAPPPIAFGGPSTSKIKINRRGRLDVVNLERV